MPNNNDKHNGFAIGAGRTHDLTVAGISRTPGGSVAGASSLRGSVRATSAVPSVAASGITLPATARQLVGLLVDGSGSMEEVLGMLGSVPGVGGQTKAQAVATATSELLAELSKSSLAANFSLIWIPWAERVLDTFGPVPLNQVDLGRDWNPGGLGGNGTLMGTGLEAVTPTVRTFLGQATAERMPASAVIVGMTDGKDFDGDRALRAAEELRGIEGVTLATCRFGTDAAADALLQRMASPGFYQAAHNAEELRRFFLKSVTNANPPRMLPSGQA